jgi:tetratricopeptide (TPR) repeat protein
MSFPLLHVKHGLAALALFCAVASSARADEQAEVNRLVTAGETAQALARLEQMLAQRPRDPQLRFQKGVMLAELQRRTEAVDIFTQLTVDYPEIPEPYNNLAVLHAFAGDYAKARTALDAALRANPNYAVAHQNMGDLHAQLALQSYSQALKLDPANDAIPPKMAVLRELVIPVTSAPAKRSTP